MARKQSRARKNKPGMYRGQNHKAEAWAVHRVHTAIIEELKWHSGDNPLPDFGVDVLTEIVAADDLVSGQLIGIQVKGGDSFFKKRKGDQVFSSDDDHLAYWLGNSLPVIVVLVNEKREAFWQAITPDTVRERKSGFSVVVPCSQRFDASALEPLLELARQRTGLAGSLPEHYAVLPTAAVRPLRRAEGADQQAAARLAQRLGSGRDHPDLAVRSLLAVQPTWISRSPAAQDLWLAAGAYAEQHGYPGVAGTAFAEAAQAHGPQSALASAAAGLALLFTDRSAAREHLLRAREGGQIMLAEVGLSLLEVPEGQMTPPAIPPSVSSASAEELDERPNVLSFLANNAARRDDLDAAVSLSERAVASAGDQESALRMELARLIHRRAVSRDLSPREIRRAVQHARAVIEERRRWAGPSAEALAFVLDIHITGDTAAAVAAALPASEGGTALDAEADSPDVAFRGALAALLTGNALAYQFLLGRLPEGRHRCFLLATEIEEAAQPAAERLQAWTVVLETPGDESLAVEAIAALARLGQWPRQADDMHDRGMLPDDAYQLLRAVCHYYAGDRVIGVARLRALAGTSALAAIELVRLIEDRDGWAAAAAECERQLRRWPASQLRLKLLDLHGKNGNLGQAEELVRQVVPDASFADSVRLDLCEWYTAQKATQGSPDEAAAFAEQGLVIGDHPGLAWNLVKILHKSGKITRARHALGRYRPEPVSDDETTLWMQLHLGVALSADDARIMVGIAERQPDGDFRDATIGLLAREVLFTSPEPGSPFPSDVTDAVTRLLEQAESRPGTLLHLEDDEEALRARLTVTQPDPVAYQAVIRQVHRDHKGQADLARFVRQPYAAVLLHRPAGIIPATDLRTGLRSVGEAAAREAIQRGRCAIDLSSLHLLGLLNDDDRLLILAALPNMTTARSAVADAVLMRDKIRALGVSTYTAALRHDGSVEKTTLTAAQHAALRDQAEALEAGASSIEIRSPAASQDAPADTMAIAREVGLPLWCDDMALRQQARHRSVPTFSLLDLVTELTRQGTPVDLRSVLRRLASHYVVDLPLDADDIIEIAAANDWHPGPAHTALARPAWWHSQSPDWPGTWLAVVTEARKHSAVAFLDITKAALTGALNSVTPGHRTMRYQELVVISLTACHLAGTAAPLGLLDQLAAFTFAAFPGHAVPARPQFVLRAFEGELTSRSIPHPQERARQILPDTNGAIA
jgi:hypothetical protein